MDEAGFPPGTVNLVTGSGPEVGDAIVDSPDVNVISFTGNSATGQSIAERAGRRLKRLSLELGGKNAIDRACADADLDLAVDGILWSAFGTTGPALHRVQRVIVDQPRRRSRGRLESATKVLRLGSGLDEGVDVGPLINAGAVEKVERYVEIGRAEGELVTGGERATRRRPAHGHFFAPTILDGRRARWTGSPRRRSSGRCCRSSASTVTRRRSWRSTACATGSRRSIYTRDTNTAFRAMRDFDTGHRLRQRRHDRRRDAPAVRRHQADRQRPPRGGPRGARHVHRVEVDLRRLLGPPPARADRQPVAHRGPRRSPATSSAPRFRPT